VETASTKKNSGKRNDRQTGNDEAPGMAALATGFGSATALALDKR